MGYVILSYVGSTWRLMGLSTPIQSPGRIKKWIHLRALRKNPTSWNMGLGDGGWFFFFSRLLGWRTAMFQFIGFDRRIYTTGILKSRIGGSGFRILPTVWVRRSGYLEAHGT